MNVVRSPRERCDTLPEVAAPEPGSRPARGASGRHSSGRRGVSVIEVTIGMGVLATAAALVAQVATWAVTERAASDARLEAVEVVANQLEEARARPWADLTPEWAAARKLPDHVSARWPDAALAVAVEPEPGRRRVRRVTATLRWTGDGRTRWSPVSVAALYADRTPGAAP